MTDARFSRWGGRLAAYLARADAITTTARLLFAVYGSPQFPRSLWNQFRATSTARGIPWLDALREAVERYVNTEVSR